MSGLTVRVSVILRQGAVMQQSSRQYCFR